MVHLLSADVCWLSEFNSLTSALHLTRLSFRLQKHCWCVRFVSTELVSACRCLRNGVKFDGSKTVNDPQTYLIVG